MNIFRLDTNPTLAAKYHCDKHVVKMILESAQLLSTAHHVLGSPSTISGIYKKTHQNHPSAIWVRECSENYVWTHQLALALCKEYQYRYGEHKTHKSTVVLNELQKLPEHIAHSSAETPFRLAMPDQYKCDDPVEAYRRYYIGEKAAIATWKIRGEPSWWSKP